MFREKSKLCQKCEKQKSCIDKYSDAQVLLMVKEIKDGAVIECNYYQKYRDPIDVAEVIMSSGVGREIMNAEKEERPISFNQEELLTRAPEEFIGGILNLINSVMPGMKSNESQYHGLDIKWEILKAVKIQFAIQYCPTETPTIKTIIYLFLQGIYPDVETIDIYSLFINQLADASGVYQVCHEIIIAPVKEKE